MTLVINQSYLYCYGKSNHVSWRWITPLKVLVRVTRLGRVVFLDLLSEADGCPNEDSLAAMSRDPAPD